MVVVMWVIPGRMWHVCKPHYGELIHNYYSNVDITRYGKTHHNREGENIMNMQRILAVYLFKSVK
jgi:hypothetical protein